MLVSRNKNTCDMANSRRSDGEKDFESHSSFEVSDESMSSLNKTDKKAEATGCCKACHLLTDMRPPVLLKTQ